MKQFTVMLAALVLASSAHALKIRPYEGKTTKSAPAFFTTEKPSEVNTGEALEKALNGEQVFKCQPVEAAATKTGATLKPKKD